MVAFERVAQRLLLAASIFTSGGSCSAAYQGQRPLGPGLSDLTWDLKEQNDSLCDARSRQYTGTVRLDEHKSQFFWFFESLEDAGNKPLAIWLNGGPGASSLGGLFTEIGPCSVNEHGNATIFNPNSWSHDFNLLFIDQPSGVGFSLVDDPANSPLTLEESSRDILTTLEVFFGKMFPNFQGREFYIMGESFGGRSVPRYAYDIVQRQSSSSRYQTSIPALSGIVLVSAFVDSTYTSLGYHEYFCQGYQTYFTFNETICANFAKAMPTCADLGSRCRSTSDPDDCEKAMEYCASNVDIYVDLAMLAGLLNPYDVRLKCTNPPVCLDSLGTGMTTYLNRVDVQSVLGFEPMKYLSINFELNSRWSQQPGIYVPSTEQVAFLLNETSVDILVLNGDLDVHFNSPGMKMQSDELPWHGQRAYSEQAWQDWFFQDTATSSSQRGGVYKSSGQLTFATVIGAGHMLPGDQPESSRAMIRQWLYSL